MKNLFSAPDNVNKKSVIFFIGLLFFWYPTLVISGLTEDRFFFISNIILSNLGAYSRIVAMAMLVVVLFALPLFVFYKKRFRLMNNAVLWADVFVTSVLLRLLTEPYAATEQFGLGYYYSFFSHVIPRKVLENLLVSFSERAIGWVSSFILITVLFLVMMLGNNISGKLKGEEKNGAV